METKMISVADASRILGITERHVRRLCMEGTIDSEKSGKAYLVNFDSVIVFRENGQTPEEDTDMESGSDVRNISETGVSDDSDIADTHSEDDVRNNSDVRSIPSGDNGHVRKVPKENADMNSPAPLPMSDNGQIPSEEDDLHVRVEEISIALDLHLEEEQQQVSLIKDTLSLLLGSFSSARGKVLKTQSTLRNLLSEIEDPTQD